MKKVLRNHRLLRHALQNPMALWLGVCLICGISFASEDVELERLLKQIESVGRTFRSFSAQFTQKKYTAILKEFDTPETGDFFYARAKDGSALMRQEIRKPGKRVFTIKGSVATNYQPDLKQAQIVNLGKNKDKAEYLAIGLGQSPGKLRSTFDMKYLGPESIDGAACAMLQLKPKSASAAAYFSTITLWIKKSSGVPIQQKLEEPSGDYVMVKFTAERLNAPIPDSKFEQKLPAGTDIQRLQ
jgi:outer membrane lipoprotein-sorting protein